MIYLLSFQVFHKHFSNVNFISRTSAATYLQADYFIPRHLKTASKKLNEKLFKNTYLKMEKYLCMGSSENTKSLDASNFLKLTHIP